MAKGKMFGRLSIATHSCDCDLSVICKCRRIGVFLHWGVFLILTFSRLEGQTLNIGRSSFECWEAKLFVGRSNFECWNDKMLKCWNVKMLKHYQKSVIDVAVT